MIKRWLVACAGVVAAFGCVTGGTDPARIEIAYTWSGGFAPMSARLDIYSDGRSTLQANSSAPVTKTLSADRLALVRSLVHSADFRALARSYVPANTCCDRRSHRLVVSQPQGEQTVDTLDGVVQPEVLDRTLVELNQVSAAVLER